MEPSAKWVRLLTSAATGGGPFLRAVKCPTEAFVPNRDELDTVPRQRPLAGSRSRRSMVSQRRLQTGQGVQHSPYFPLWDRVCSPYLAYRTELPGAGKAPA